MTKSQKIVASILGIFFVALIIFVVYAVRPTTQPSLGSGSLYVPAYVTTFDATTTTSTIANFSGVLHSITIGTPASGDVVTVYDSATTTSPTVVMAKITESSTTVSLQFDGVFVNGLTIQQSVTSSLSVNYQQD